MYRDTIDWSDWFSKQSHRVYIWLAERNQWIYLYAGCTKQTFEERVRNGYGGFKKSEMTCLHAQEIPRELTRKHYPFERFGFMDLSNAHSNKYSYYILPCYEQALIDTIKNTSELFPKVKVVNQRPAANYESFMNPYKEYITGGYGYFPQVLSKLIRSVKI